MSLHSLVAPGAAAWNAVRRAGVCRWLSTTSGKPTTPGKAKTGADKVGRKTRADKVHSVRVGDVMLTMDSTTVTADSAQGENTIREKIEDIERAQSVAREFSDIAETSVTASKIKSGKMAPKPRKPSSAEENQEKLASLQRLNEEAEKSVPVNYAGLKTKSLTNTKRRTNKKNDRYALLMHLQYVHADSQHDKADLLPDTKTFIAVYTYLKSFGLTDEELVQMAQRHYRIFRLSVEYNLALKIQYFRTLGCDHDDLRHALKTNPQIFSLTLRHLGEKTQLLMQMNIPKASIPKLICFPWVMIRSATLLSRLQLCRAVGCTPEDIVKLLLIRSPLLTYSTHTVRLGVIFLLKQGYPIERIPALQQTTPGVIVVKRETLYRASRSFELLLGMPIEQFYAHFLVRYPILSYLKPKNIFGMFTLLASLGCGVEDVRQFIRHQATFLSADVRVVASRLEYLASELNFPLTQPLDVARYQRVALQSMPLFDLMHLKLGPKYNVMIFRGGVPVVSNVPISMTDPKHVDNEKKRLQLLQSNMPDVSAAISFQTTRLLVEGRSTQQAPGLLPCGPLDMSQVRVLSVKPTRKPFSLLDTFISKQPRSALVAAQRLTDDEYQLEYGRAALEGDGLVRSIINSNRTRLQNVLDRIDKTDFDNILDEAMQVSDVEHISRGSGFAVNSEELTFNSNFDISEQDLEEVKAAQEGDVVEEQYDLVGGHIVSRETGQAVDVQLESEPVDLSFLSDKKQLDREFPWMASHHRELNPEEQTIQKERYAKTSKILSNIMQPREDEFPRSDLELLAKFVLNTDFSSTLIAEDKLSSIDKDFFKFNSPNKRISSKVNVDEGEVIVDVDGVEEKKEQPAPNLNSMQVQQGDQIYSQLTDPIAVERVNSVAQRMNEKHQRMLAELQAKKQALADARRKKSDAAVMRLKAHAATRLGKVEESIALEEEMTKQVSAVENTDEQQDEEENDDEQDNQRNSNPMFVRTGPEAGLLGEALSASIPQGSRLGQLRKIQLCDETVRVIGTKKEALQKNLAEKSLSEHEKGVLEAELQQLLKQEDFFLRHRNLSAALPQSLLNAAKKMVSESTINAFELSMSRDAVAPLVSLAYTKSSILMLDEELNVMPKISLVHALSTIWTSTLSRLTGVELYNQSRLQQLRSYTIHKESSLAYCLEGSLSASSSFYSFLNGSPGMPHTVALSAIYKSPAIIYNSFNIRVLPRAAITALRTMGHRKDSHVMQIEAYEQGKQPNVKDQKNLQAQFAKDVQSSRFENPFVLVSPREAELYGYNHDQVVFEPADPSAAAGSPESRDRYSVIIAGYVPGNDVIKRQHHYLKKKGSTKRESWGNNSAEHPYFDPFFVGLDKAWPETYGEYVRLLEDARQEYAILHPDSEPLVVTQSEWLDELRDPSNYKVDDEELDEELVDTLESITSEIPDSTSVLARRLHAHKRVVFKYTLEFPELMMPAQATFNFLPQMKPTVDSRRLYTVGPARPDFKEAFATPRVPVNHPLPAHVPEAQLFQATEPFAEPRFIEQGMGDTFFDEFIDMPFLTSASHQSFFEDRLVNPDLLIPMQRDLRIVTALLERARRRQRYGTQKGLDPMYVLGKSPRSHVSRDFFSENKLL